MQFERDGDYLMFRRPITAETLLTLRASGVRQERTGAHARLEILLNQATLAWGQLNVEKDEDRVRFCNSAYAHIKPHKAVADRLPKEDLKADVDAFCASLWEQHVQQHLPSLMEGAANPKPPTMLVDPYIIEGGGTMLFGPPGRGKSWIIMILAVLLSAGLKFPFLVPRPRNVLFINIERSADSVRNRLGCINRALGLPPTRPLLTLNARGRSLLDVLPGLQKSVREQHIDCVLLDSISRAGFGDLNDNQIGNRIVDALNGLAPSWFALAHTPRADPTHAFGTIHFDAGADIMLQLLSQQDDAGPLGVAMKVTKKNDFGFKPLEILALEFTEAGVKTIRLADRHEFPDIEQEKKQDKAFDLKQLLLDKGPMSATDAAETLGMNRTYVAELFNKNPQFVPVRRDGPRVLYGVAYGV